jgi:hypothetical protein
VDWAGISVYQQFDGTLGTVADIENFCNFAKSRNKPVMIAESTPYGGISDARWTDWFLPCLDLIHREHIQMWSYIDTDWDALPMFAGQGWGDSRIENNPFIRSNWFATVCCNPVFLQQSPQLYPRLHADATNCWCEAENALLNGVSIYSDPEASGGAAVSGLNAPGRSVTFINTGNTAQQIVLRYSAANFGTVGLYRNSQPRRTLPLPPTGTGYSDLLVHEPVPPGAIVKIQFDSGDTSVNLDALLFRSYQDSDHDGLPDDWELLRFGTLNHGHDGSPGYADWVTDADPLNPSSALRLNSITSGPGTATLSISHSVSRTCFIEQSADLKNWSLSPAIVQTNTALANALLTGTPPGTAFYRLLVP